MMDELVALRMERQQLLHRDEPPHCVFLLDETAVRRPVGGRRYWRVSSRGLLELAELPAVRLHVVPLAVDEHAGLPGVVLVRDSKDPSGPGLIFAPEACARWSRTFTEHCSTAPPTLRGMALVPPQKLAQERVIKADAVLGGQVDLRAYPHRHLMIIARHKWGSSGFPPLMEAVEHLSNYGWELVNVLSVGEGNHVYAAMRRAS